MQTKLCARLEFWPLGKRISLISRLVAFTTLFETEKAEREDEKPVLSTKGKRSLKNGLASDPAMSQRYPQTTERFTPHPTPRCGHRLLGPNVLVRRRRVLFRLPRDVQRHNSLRESHRRRPGGEQRTNRSRRSGDDFKPTGNRGEDIRVHVDAKARADVR